MADFVLVYSGGSVPETEEAQAKVMQAWTDWYANLGPAIKDGGNPFSPVAKTVSSDGSISDVSGTVLTGYTILTADSIDRATELAKGCPVLDDGGQVHVYETFEVR
ncbi:MAG TPA: hypothetical protein VEC15_11260 [Actinomycetota bacterium]|jgi:hypothetical protein|nr:hypothetical protein [Actinomycetota bacterium]